MPPKGTKRDPYLNCELVKIYRDVVRLQLNHIQRAYVAQNVSCCERGQRLWRATLIETMRDGRNPRNIGYIVKLWGNQFYTESAKFQEYIAEATQTEV